MNSSLTVLITSFFTNYLPNIVGYSENTVNSYRDTFVLLFNFAMKTINVRVNVLESIYSAKKIEMESTI